MSVAVENKFPVRLAKFGIEVGWGISDKRAGKPIELTYGTDVDLASLDELEDTELRVLDLSRLQPYRISIASRDIDKLAVHKNLEGLSLAHSTVDDHALEKLSTLSNVKRLDLSNTYVTDAAFVHLCKLPMLEQIKLQNTGVSYLMLPMKELFGDGKEDEELRNLAKLESLVLRDCKLVCNGAMTRIKEFLPTIQRLDITNTRVDKTGLTFLTGHKSLWMLALGGPAIDDAALTVLEAFEQLQRISLNTVNVSSAAMIALMKKLPKAVITVDGWLVDEFLTFL